MGQNIKTCNTCEHVVGSGRWSKCSKYETEPVVNLVTGETTTIGGKFFHAETVRLFSHLCGREGRWYEPKVKTPKSPSLLRRFKLWLSK